MSLFAELSNGRENIGRWSLVADRSEPAFKNRVLRGLVNVKGRFTRFSGEGQITNDTTVTGRIDIKAASVDTKSGGATITCTQNLTADVAAAIHTRVPS